MSKFEIGEKVKVRGIHSNDSILLNGKIGTITHIFDEDGYVFLDIEPIISGKNIPGGIWLYELISLKPKEIKVFPIVKFLKGIEK